VIFPESEAKSDLAKPDCMVEQATQEIVTGPPFRLLGRGSYTSDIYDYVKTLNRSFLFPFVCFRQSLSFQTGIAFRFWQDPVQPPVNHPGTGE